MYRNNPDPWDVATSWYERRKAALTLALLRRERYPVAWDPACGTGHLAVGLTGRVDRLVCSDLSPTACELTVAALREAGVEATRPDDFGGRPAITAEPSPLTGDVPTASVHVSRLPRVPSPLQERQADLVVLSEILYYLDEGERAATWAALDSVCHALTDVVAVHWGPQPEDAHLSGAAAQRELNAHLGSRGYYRLVTHTDVEFVAALWSRQAPHHIGR